MTSIAYRLYTQSSLWWFRRWLWFTASDRRCEGCGVELVLHRADLRPGCRVLTVHHVHYRTLGRERRRDVLLLCWPCHCRRDWWRHR